MPRISSTGKPIFSAGEVSSYVVCPEAWKLEYLNEQTTKHERSRALGGEMHIDWLVRANEALFFTWGVRLIIYMILLVILFYFFALTYR